MAGGLLALLDDVAAIAKVAAASLDDVAAQAAKAGSKAAGIVIDDAAVTPRYVVGFAADRELPIVGKIAWGSLKNKILFLLPGALALNYLAPWIITPLLMAGGVFLCFEGYEKVHEMVTPSAAKAKDHAAAPVDAKALEDTRVAGAIRTDMILSAEIMAITLASVAQSPFWTQAAVLAAVGLGITALVYGAVALIVKADDVGVALARRGGAVGAIGVGIVKAMPSLLKALSVIGMMAMLWVGGGIILHGFAGFGLAGPEHAIEGVARGVAVVAPLAGSFIQWLVAAALAGLFGLAIGYLAEKALHAGRLLRRG
jgi:predicted DNA repair protein MutK